jgi:hypothetical protein
MARRLLLFAALLTLAGATPAAALAATPADPSSDAENCARAFLSAAPTCTPALAGESPCTHTGSIVGSARITAGCCVATKSAGEKPVRRIYEHNPKHRAEPYIDSRGREVSRAPRGDCQAMLDCSVQRKPTSPERVGTESSTGRDLIFRRHLRQELSDEIREYFHGFVP